LSHQHCPTSRPEMAGALPILLAALAALARASEEVVPESEKTEWRYYVNFDADTKASFDVHEETVVESSRPTRSKFPRGPPPVECYDICYEDPSCHGFVLYDHKCWFKGGGAEGPRHLHRVKKERGGASLFIIYGPHPVDPVIDAAAVLGSSSGIALGLLALVAVAAGVVATVAVRNRKCPGKQKDFPLFVPQATAAPEPDESQSCDTMICGSRKKKKAAPSIPLV